MMQVRFKVKPRDMAVALVLMVALLGAIVAGSPSNLALGQSATCGIQGCVSTPVLSSSTTYLGTTSFTSTETATSTTVSTSISSSTTTTSATTTSTFFSYTSTISTTVTTTSYSTIYTATQSSLASTIITLASTSVTTGTFTALVTEKGTSLSCPVSYVTNGNRLQPYAQFLRNFRDNQIENTTAGRAFLTTFNAWYYSWAPAIAYSAATNPFVYRMVQIGVVPLLGILYASYGGYELVAPLSPEAAALTAGVIAASLIGLAYVAPVAYLARRILRRNARFNLSNRTLTPTLLWLVGSVLTLALAYAANSTPTIAIGSVSLILSTLSAGSLLGTRALSQIGLPTINPATLPIYLRRYTYPLTKARH